MSQVKSVFSTILSFSLVSLLCNCSQGTERELSPAQRRVSVAAGLESEGSTIVPFGSPVQAPAPQIARFIHWLDIIDQTILGKTPADAADALELNDTRNITFNLQALGQVYGEMDPEFETMRKQFKALEDGIGNYQKWRDLVEDAINQGSSPEVLARVTANRDAARKDFESMLISSHFLTSDGVTLPYTLQLRAFLNGYAWPDATTDRIYVAKKLIARLEETRTAKYDFSHLEAGNGVHEFRRKMRWFAMQARGLNGLVTLKDKSEPCPIPEYQNMINSSTANTKYAVLPPSRTEPNPITISACLYIENAKLVDVVNGIKAKAELSDSLSETGETDGVEEADQKYLNDLLAHLLDNNIFGLLEDEIRAAVADDVNTPPNQGKPDQGDQDKPKDYSLPPEQVAFYGANKVHRIEINGSQWDNLAAQNPAGGLCGTSFVGKEYTWYHFDQVKIDGVAFTDVGIKKRSWCDAFSTTKPSLNVNLTKYNDLNKDPAKANFGTDELTLNNSIKDPSYERECFAYRLMEKAGIPAPSCNFARVIANGQDLGLYVSVQPQEKAYLKSRFAKNLGNVYEASFENFQASDLDRYKNDLESYKPDEDKSLADLKALMSVLNADALDMDQLQQVLDLPYFINYWAAEELLRVTDGFIAANNNAYLYFPPNGKMRVLPDGSNQLLDVPPASAQNARSLDSRNLIALRLSAVPGIRDQVDARVRDLLTFYWNEAALIQDLDATYEVLRKAVPAAELNQYAEAHGLLKNNVLIRKMELGYTAPLVVPPVPAPIVYPIPDAAQGASR